MRSTLHTWATNYRAWLFERALPLWWEVGADHRRGGFFERIDQAGQPTEDPRRIRVQARQIFVYAEAGRLGWAGPWDKAIRHGLEFLERVYRRPDALYRTAVTPDGSVFDDSVDLYDQAFVLLALAHAYEQLGSPSELRSRAQALLEQLVDRLAHPLGGFNEANSRLPLRSNPHMHMLEALLAWVALGENGLFHERATDIIRLVQERLIDHETGSIGEYYNQNWSPTAGSLGQEREPGHQFEWAFLLRQAEALLGITADELPARLRRFGETHGIASTGAAVFSVTREGTVIDGSARLWAQTERLRTSLIFRDINAAEDAARVIGLFLATQRPGLWRDRMLSDGFIVDGPAPGSTLYHLITAFTVLFDTAELNSTSNQSI